MSKQGIKNASKGVAHYVVLEQNVQGLMRTVQDLWELCNCQGKELIALRKECADKVSKAQFQAGLLSHRGGGGAMTEQQLEAMRLQMELEMKKEMSQSLAAGQSSANFQPGDEGGLEAKIALKRLGDRMEELQEYQTLRIRDEVKRYADVQAQRLEAAEGRLGRVAETVQVVHDRVKNLELASARRDAVLRRSNQASREGRSRAGSPFASRAGSRAPSAPGSRRGSFGGPAAAGLLTDKSPSPGRRTPGAPSPSSVSYRIRSGGGGQALDGSHQDVLGRLSGTFPGASPGSAYGDRQRGGGGGGGGPAAAAAWWAPGRGEGDGKEEEDAVLTGVVSARVGEEVFAVRVAGPGGREQELIVHASQLRAVSAAAAGGAPAAAPAAPAPAAVAPAPAPAAAAAAVAPAPLAAAAEAAPAAAPPAPAAAVPGDSPGGGSSPWGGAGAGAGRGGPEAGAGPAAAAGAGTAAGTAEQAVQVVETVSRGTQMVGRRVEFLGSVAQTPESYRRSQQASVGSPDPFGSTGGSLAQPPGGYLDAGASAYTYGSGAASPWGGGGGGGNGGDGGGEELMGTSLRSEGSRRSARGGGGGGAGTAGTGLGRHPSTIQEEEGSLGSRGGGPAPSRHPQARGKAGARGGAGSVRSRQSSGGGGGRRAGGGGGGAPAMLAEAAKGPNLGTSSFKASEDEDVFIEVAGRLHQIEADVEDNAEQVNVALARMKIMERHHRQIGDENAQVHRAQEALKEQVAVVEQTLSQLGHQLVDLLSTENGKLSKNEQMLGLLKARVDRVEGQGKDLSQDVKAMREGFKKTMERVDYKLRRKSLNERVDDWADCHSVGTASVGGAGMVDPALLVEPIADQARNLRQALQAALLELERQRVQNRTVVEAYDALALEVKVLRQNQQLALDRMLSQDTPPSELASIVPKSSKGIVYPGTPPRFPRGCGKESYIGLPLQADYSGSAKEIKMVMDSIDKQLRSMAPAHPDELGPEEGNSSVTSDLTKEKEQQSERSGSRGSRGRRLRIKGSSKLRGARRPSSKEQRAPRRGTTGQEEEEGEGGGRTWSKGWTPSAPASPPVAPGAASAFARALLPGARAVGPASDPASPAPPLLALSPEERRAQSRQQTQPPLRPPRPGTTPQQRHAAPGDARRRPPPGGLLANLPGATTMWANESDLAGGDASAEQAYHSPLQRGPLLPRRSATGPNQEEEPSGHGSLVSSLQNSIMKEQLVDATSGGASGSPWAKTGAVERALPSINNFAAAVSAGREEQGGPRQQHSQTART